jgi:hypothetical protein
MSPYPPPLRPWPPPVLISTAWPRSHLAPSAVRRSPCSLSDSSSSSSSSYHIDLSQYCTSVCISGVESGRTLLPAAGHNTAWSSTHRIGSDIHLDIPTQAQIHARTCSSPSLSSSSTITAISSVSTPLTLPVYTPSAGR